MISAAEALDRLRDGNRRFVSQERGRDGNQNRSPGPWLSGRQEPFAIVLGCSDSRVPMEIIFDQGLGDLFVVRVAGNIVAPPILGSIEFAAQEFGTRLVVVLGHTECGAVLASLETIERSGENPSPNLQSIIDRVLPSVEESVKHGRDLEPDDVVRDAIRRNVRASAAQIRRDSRVLAGLIETDGLRIVGAEYSIDTGEVEFFDKAGIT
jgi:carbonic anhydrase